MGPFKGELSWLSNFQPVKVIRDGVQFPSVENAYASAKCKYKEDVEGFIDCTAAQAKRKGRSVCNREDWDEIKLSVMEDLCRQKFNQEPFKSKLIETGDQEIIEWNAWKDVFWGKDIKTGEGQNHLGKIIMKIRDEVKASQ